MNRRRVHLPVVADHLQEAQLGGSSKARPLRFPHPGYSREIVRDAEHPVEREIETESGELLSCIAMHTALGLTLACCLLLAYMVKRRQYVRYRAARLLAGTFEARPGLPGPTRASCPADRKEVGCGYLQCTANLFRVEEPPGRPGLQHVPRSRDTGWTESVAGDLGPRQPMSPDPRWLEPGPMPVSCALDAAGQGAHDNRSLGEIVGKHRTLVARVVDRALHSFKANGGTVEGLRLLIGDDEKPSSNLAQAIEERR